MEEPGGGSSSDRPPWVRTFLQDIADVFLALFVYFLGSMVIWPIILVLSILLLPISLIWRNLMLRFTIDCVCGVGYLSCQCRQMLTADEMNWIVFESKHPTAREFRTRQTQQLGSQRVVNQSSGDRPTRVSMDIEQLDPLLRQDEPSPPYRSSTLDELAHESTPSNFKLIHTVVMIIEKGVSTRRICHLVNTRIVQLQKPQSKQLYFPRFTQCLVELRGGSKAWVSDQAFKLNEHITVLSDTLNNQADLQSLLASLNSSGLPFNIPLWHLTLVPGYGLAGETVLIWRFHASMLDGVSIASVLANALSSAKILPNKPLSHLRLYQSHMIKFIMVGPVSFLAMLFKPRVRSHTSNTGLPEKPPGPEKEQFTWTERTLTHSQLLKNKLILQTSVNDMIVSLLAGAKRGASTSSATALSAINHLLNQPKVLLAVNTWTRTNSNRVIQGNRLQFLPLKLPNREEIIPRMWNASFNLTALKLHGATYTQDVSLAWFHRLPLPSALYRTIVEGLRNGCENMLTTLNGTNSVPTIDRSNVTDIMYFSALPPSIKSSLNFITYSGLIKLSVQSRSVDPDLGKTVDMLLLSMFRQMIEIDSMVFKRYFPDGLPTGAPGGPQTEIPIDKSSREFIGKLLCLEEGGRTTTPPRSPRSRPPSPFTFSLPGSSRKTQPTLMVHPFTGIPITIPTNQLVDDNTLSPQRQASAPTQSNQKLSSSQRRNKDILPDNAIVSSPIEESAAEFPLPPSQPRTDPTTIDLAVPSSNEDVTRPTLLAPKELQHDILYEEPSSSAIKHDQSGSFVSLATSPNRVQDLQSDVSMVTTQEETQNQTAMNFLSPHRVEDGGTVSSILSIAETQTALTSTAATASDDHVSQN